MRAQFTVRERWRAASGDARKMRVRASHYADIDIFRHCYHVLLITPCHVFATLRSLHIAFRRRFSPPRRLRFRRFAADFRHAISTLRHYAMPRYAFDLPIARYFRYFRRHRMLPR